jgi:hypothetical protein
MLDEQYRKELRVKLELAALKREIELAKREELHRLRIQRYGLKKAEDMAAREDAINRIMSRSH